MVRFLQLLVLLVLTLTVSTAQAQHWSFPGSITSHLTQDHGVSTAGLSYGEMLTLHDQLHGSSQMAVTATRVRVTQRPLRFLVLRAPVRSVLATRPVLRFFQARPVRSFLFR